MYFFINPAKAFIVGFLVVLFIILMPLIPGILMFSSAGDGIALETPPPGAVLADRRGEIVPDNIYLWPLPGITNRGWGFGYRFHPIDHVWRMHNGIDIGTYEGRNIIAVGDGIVTLAGNKGGYGKCVMIDHGGNVESLYGHCSSLLVKKNQTVKKGDIIAKVGSTGLSTDPHLHFEIRIGGSPVDPLPYVTR